MMDKVTEEGSSKPAFEGGGMEGVSICNQSINDQASGLYLDDNLIKCLTMDDTSCFFHYDLFANGGGPDSGAAGVVKDEFGYGGGLHAMLPEYKVVRLCPTVYLADAFEDYYRDVDFSKAVPELDYYFSEDSGTGDSSSLNHSPGTSNDALGSSASSTAFPTSECNQHDKTMTATTCESGDSCASKCGCEMLFKRETGVNSSSLYPSLGEGEEANDVSSSVVVCNSYLHRNKSSTDASNDLEDICDASPVDDGVGGNDLSSHGIMTVKLLELRKARTCAGNKKVRRLPSKHSGGTFDVKRLPLIVRKGKEELTIESEEDNRVEARSNRLRCNRAKAMALVVRETMRSHSVKQEAEESDEEYEPSRSNSGKKRSKRDADRRKQNKVWTLAEVMKLVDGISQFGVGKWTAIQKGYFTSSPHRTSLDIRDKWRNLLRTSYSRLRGRKMDTNNWKNGSIVLPEALIQRIYKLDSVHPYTGLDLKLARAGSHGNGSKPIE